jgi:hypothetical protein
MTSVPVANRDNGPRKILAASHLLLLMVSK